jgi:endonuclease YncB( thermonuclease family)
VKIRDINRYKRTAAETILPDGRNLNQEIVRAGLAWWYQQCARRETVLWDLAQEARDAKRGLWSDPKPVEPWEWRRWPPQSNCHGTGTQCDETAF